jgi:AcrR family transcriptional regulator
VAIARKKPADSAGTRKKPAAQADPVPQRHHGYKQQRSLQTFERLLAAAEALLLELPFDEVSVNDICVRAGLSVGAFYRRFESREGLLQVLHENYTERAVHLQAAALSPERWEGVPLEEMFVQVIEEITKVTQQNSGLLRATAHLADSDPDFAAREGKIHAEFHACMTRLILLRVDSVGHPRPRTAAEFCAWQLGAALFYRLQVAPIFKTLSNDLTERQFISELARASVAYLADASAYAPRTPNAAIEAVPEPNTAEAIDDVSVATADHQSAPEATESRTKNRPRRRAPTVTPVGTGHQ